MMKCPRPDKTKEDAMKCSALMLTMFCVITVACSSVLGKEAAQDPRIERVERGLLPRISLTQDLGVTASITQRMARLGIPGVSVAVIDEGKLAWARAYGFSDTVEKTPVTTETVFQAGSISKPVAALGALRLVNEGKLSLDQDVNAKLERWHIPENEHTATQKVTLRRLLSHTAGLTVHGYPGYAAGAQIPTVVQVLDGEMPANTGPVRVNVPPGILYRYSGGGYTVMQLLMADVANEPFESFAQSKVLDVLGMASSTYAQDLPDALASRRASAHRPGGQRIDGKFHRYPEMAAAGLWTTPSDLAKYLLYMQRALRGSPGELLSPTLAKEIVVRQSEGHGLGPEVYEVGEFARFGHSGVDEGFEASMVAYVAQGKGLVIMANANRSNMLFDEIKGSVARAYEWPAFPTRPQIEARPILPAVLSRAPGKYQFSATEVVTLTASDGRLFFKMTKGDVVELFAKNDMELFAPALGQVSFQLIEIDGQMTSLKGSDGGELTRIR
jgi:CubicO group peptidase (beta-lactamase class C family)